MIQNYKKKKFKTIMISMGGGGFCLYRFIGHTSKMNVKALREEKG